MKKNILVKLVPLLLLVLIAIIIGAMYFSQPEPRKRPQFEKPVIVEVDVVKFEPFQVYIESYGNIEAKTSGNLVAQVSGVITSVSKSLETGGSFKKGDLLATVDDKDYKIEVTIAQAELANAQLTLQQEQALAEQARRDWEKINPNRKASDLVLKKPQVASAKARLDAAKARLAKAQLALSRTKVLAPYDGKVISKQSDLGQLVNQNTPIAQIFATSSLEVRLPIPTNKVEFLPSFGGQDNVELTADFGSFSKTWLAKLDRSDSVIDQSSRQWFVTAKIDGSLLDSDSLLKVGQFVNAKIYGVEVEQAIVIPSKLIYDNDQVYLYENGKLVRRSIVTQWQAGEVSLIKSGLEEGEKIITTPLRFVADGAKLQIKGKSPQRPASQKAKKVTVSGESK